MLDDVGHLPDGIGSKDEALTSSSNCFMHNASRTFHAIRSQSIPGIRGMYHGLVSSQSTYCFIAATSMLSFGEGGRGSFVVR